MKRKLLLPLTALLTTAVIGCASLLPKPMEELSVSGRAENEFCEIYVMSVDRETLVNRFGRTNNPFIAPQMLLTPKYFYMFSVTVNARKTFTLDTGGIELLASSFEESPDGIEEVVRFWQTNTDNESAAELKNLAKKEPVIRKNLFPNSVTLHAGESYTGYILFMSPARIRDPETMTLPAGSSLILSL